MASTSRPQAPAPDPAPAPRRPFSTLLTRQILSSRPVPFILSVFLSPFCTGLRVFHPYSAMVHFCPTALFCLAPSHLFFAHFSRSLFSLLVLSSASLHQIPAILLCLFVRLFCTFSPLPFPWFFLLSIAALTSHLSLPFITPSSPLSFRPS